MAVLIPLQPMVDGTTLSLIYRLYYRQIPFKNYGRRTILENIISNIADENMGEAYSLLKDYQQGSSVGA